MRTCLLVKDTTNNTPLCVIKGEEVYSALRQSATKLITESKLHGTLSGNGTPDRPYGINTFVDINSYIEKRNEETQKKYTLYFRFCGVGMYQYGTGTTNQDYYIGLLDEGPLSYPSMGTQIDSTDANVPLTAVNKETVQKAVGTGTTNKYEVLALAALFIAEGRRERPSLLTHLLLMDLIEDKVTFGQAQNKTRTIRRAVDISGATAEKLNRYKTTAIGDSPLAHKGAVKDSHLANNPNSTDITRYGDKTTSLAVQWVAKYFSSPQFTLEPCKPTDLRPGQVQETLDGYAAAEGGRGLARKTKQKETVNAFESRKGKVIGRYAETNLRGVPKAILTFIQTMFDLRLEFAAGGRKVPAGEAKYGKMGEQNLTKLRAAVTPNNT
jgi:hypothetical protein